MPKYSTGRSGGGDGDSCELCGRETSDLRRANVAGANLLVCSSCAPHDDSGRGRDRGGGRGGGDRDSDRGGGRGQGDEPVSRKKRAAQNAARVYDAGQSDANFEERGTNYEKDRLPYLVSDYGERVETARQAAGLRTGELAAELGVDEDDLVAVEQGRATRAGVGGSVVRKLEERLEIDLVDE
jgi:ribosome-binding protein aMBF1 (putative translation factor)